MTHEAERAMGMVPGSTGGYTVPPTWGGAKPGKKKAPKPLLGAPGTAKQKGGK